MSSLNALIYLPTIVQIIEILIAIAFVANMPSRDLLRDWQKKVIVFTEVNFGKQNLGNMPC